jgi:hypothetical protein
VPEVVAGERVATPGAAVVPTVAAGAVAAAVAVDRQPDAGDAAGSVEAGPGVWALTLAASPRIAIVATKRHPIARIDMLQTPCRNTKARINTGYSGVVFRKTKGKARAMSLPCFTIFVQLILLRSLRAGSIDSPGQPGNTDPR